LSALLASSVPGITGAGTNNDTKSKAGIDRLSEQVGTPVISDSVLVDMARLHGEGIMKWWEGGT
jgi:hypothetical protein